MNKKQTLSRLFQLSIQVAIQLEKCKINALILSAPRLISIFIFFISIFQITPLYKLGSTLQNIIGYVLVVISAASIFLDFQSEKKQNFNDMHIKFEKYLSEFQTLYIQIENSKSKDFSVLTYHEIIENYEKDFKESKLPFNIVPHSLAYRIVKRKKSESPHLWIFGADRNVKI
ncbi:hypothetical protein [Paenibacillus sp. S25]|uniref:hypothetical protein n=1 Tax=Paenibacillus sp. S25 TaxID=2823905 RepID=UPI001C649E07|nr:hypothetical protein [Paenibacillus sp. S25]QYK62415.1 hypothetical protein KAI37_02745 [Paenibacillus sp. S25]